MTLSIIFMMRVCDQPQTALLRLFRLQEFFVGLGQLACVSVGGQPLGVLQDDHGQPPADPGELVELLGALEPQSEVLLVHQVVVDAGAGEDVPPPVAFKDKPVGLADGAAQVSPEATQVDVQVPQHVPQEEEPHPPVHRLHELLAGVAVGDVLLGQHHQFKDDGGVEHPVGGLVQRGVLVDVHVHQTEDVGRHEDGAADPRQLALSLKLGEHQPEGDTSGVDHGQLVEQLVLVAQRHVEEPQADADEHEPHRHPHEPLVHALLDGVVDGDPREQKEHQVGGGVDRLGDVGQHHVVLLTPVDGGGGGAPVPVQLFGGVRPG